MSPVLMVPEEMLQQGMGGLFVRGHRETMLKERALSYQQFWEVEGMGLEAHYSWCSVMH